MSTLRNSLVAIGALGAAMSAPAAHAATVAFDDVGFGNLTGYTASNVLDSNSAVVTATITETAPGLAVVNSVAETLDGHAFTLTQHGSQIGTGNDYLAGFTFGLSAPSSIAVTDVTPGAKYVVVKDYSTDGGANGTTTPYSPSISGIGTPVSSYADLGIGKYSLIFEGVADLAVGSSTALSATISAVPLPGALVMFGSALIGLTAFGARRRRSAFTI